MRISIRRVARFPIREDSARNRSSPPPGRPHGEGYMAAEFTWQCRLGHHPFHWSRRIACCAGFARVRRGKGSGFRLQGRSVRLVPLARCAEPRRNPLAILDVRRRTVLHQPRQHPGGKFLFDAMVQRGLSLPVPEVHVRAMRGQVFGRIELPPEPRGKERRDADDDIDLRTGA